MIQQKAFKYRFYPSKAQELMLEKSFGCSRFLWNLQVAKFNYGLDFIGPTLENCTIKQLKAVYPWLGEVPYNCLEQKLRDFEEFKSQFFSKSRKSKLGRPKFKKKDSRQSIRFSVAGLSSKSKEIRAIKLGKLKLKIDREFSNPSSITISKERTGKYFVSILCKVDIEVLPVTGKEVGIDLGLKELVILSDGKVFKTPKYFCESQAELKKHQQHLSRKVRGSNRYNRQRIKVARIHEYIGNQRNHYNHGISSYLVKNFDVICTENLNVSGMVKNHKLAKSIQDASWSELIRQIEYKSNWYGRTLVKIDRFYASSKTCSHCGFKLPKLDLDTRNWKCPECSTEHDRDLNAAKNIKQEGLRNLSGESLDYGHGVFVNPDNFSLKVNNVEVSKQEG